MGNTCIAKTSAGWYDTICCMGCYRECGSSGMCSRCCGVCENGNRNGNDSRGMMYKNIFKKASENHHYQIALKNPHGMNYIHYSHHERTFVSGDNIQEWLSNLYMGHTASNHHPWTHWIVYNDEPPLVYNKADSTFIKPSSTAGHCKGVVVWNEHEMGWLIHSVPCFPDFFSPDASGGLGRVFSEMRHSEEIYGQSFGYFYFSWEKEGVIVGEKRIHDLLAHLKRMRPCIYISKNFWNTSYGDFWKIYDEHSEDSMAVEGLGKWIGVKGKCHHYAKTPKWHEDFYEELASEIGHCRAETWIRGQKIPNSERVINNEVVHSMQVSYNGKQKHICFLESQDHSKWAVSTFHPPLCPHVAGGKEQERAAKEEEERERGWIMIGDLNRMYSQQKRGGGGMVVWDNDLRRAWESLLFKKGSLSL